MKKNIFIGLIPLIIFIGLSVILWTQLGVDPKIVPQATTNQPLPAFHLPSLLDGQIQTTANLPKKPFILNVWGSWCPTCAAEQPYLVKLAKQGVVLVGVNYKDQPSDALAYLAQHGNPYLLILQDMQGDFGVDLGVTGAPESFVIDQDGRIRLHIIGAVDDTVWHTQLQPCLEHLAIKKAEHGAGQCV